MLFRNFLYILLFICLKIINILCEKKSSLTFVIDDTRSMGDDIDQVRKEVDGIMDVVLHEKSSQIDEIVLVTFNDPDVKLRIKTKNRGELKQSLDSITVHNYFNYDCPEMALSGIERALTESQPGSYIYVFTDASAKDYMNVNIIKNLCQRTQSQVFFVLTGDCLNPSGKRFMVYHEIAAASSGQVFRVEKSEVDEVIRTVNETIKGKKSVVTWTVIPPSYNFQAVPFTIDDKTEYVLVSTSGKNVDLYITSNKYNNRIATEKIMWLTSGKMLKMSNPEPGNYTAWVKGSSSISVAVYARTDFLFQHGFSELSPKSLDDTSKQPIAGKKHHLSISVTDPDHAVKINKVQIIDMSGNVYMNMPLKKSSRDFYLTDLFVSPSTMFKIKVIGTVERTGETITRNSRTPIEPQIPIVRIDPKVPVASIREGSKVDVAYDSSLVLTCKVTAYPEPKITWSDSNGKQLASESSVIEVPYDYISYLKLSNIKTSGTYTCRASNDYGGVSQAIEVTAQAPFAVNSHPEGITDGKYATEVILRCGITSRAQMRINWFYINDKTMKKEITTSNKYTISSDGTELKIKSLDLDTVGNYTCKASLLSDGNINKEYDTYVKISNLEAPVIDKRSNVVELKEYAAGVIRCKILKSTPKAKISWYFKSDTSNRFLPIAESGEELHIASAVLQSSGNYKCIAENVLGHDENIIELKVYKKPTIAILQGTNVMVSYGSSFHVSCIVTAYPPPKVVWRNDKGEIIHAENSHIDQKYEYISYLKLPNIKTSTRYYCHGENNQGKSVNHIDINVMSPFNSTQHPEGSIHVDYGKEAVLYCKVQSSLPIQIKWFRTLDKRNEEITNSNKYSISADGTELKIKSMDLDLVGQYACKASLLSDETVNKVYNTDVEIRGLVAPVIEKKSVVIESTENAPAVITCKILKSVPKPNISWLFKSRDSDKFKRLDSGEELRTTSSALYNSGYYKCIAENSLGRDEATTELIVNKAPEANIIEGGNINAAYYSTQLLTCKVTAHPPPVIIWKVEKGTLLPAQVSHLGYVFSSQVKLPNVTTSAKYYCYAENKKGRSTKSTEVNVLSPFIVTKHPEGATSVGYGKEAIIYCKIESSLPIQMQWFRTIDKGNAEITNSNKYSISADGTELKIKSMDLDLVGQYACKASLLSDENVSKTYYTDVKIHDLVVPEIDKSTAAITVRVNESTTIKCKVKGNPKPNIFWQFKRTPSDELHTIAGSNDELYIANAELVDSGYYQCTAMNVVGQDQFVTEVIVEAPPKIDLANNNVEAVEGDVSLRIPCNVIGHPEPVITWKREGIAIVAGNKYSVDDGALVIKNPLSEDKHKYTCEAKNKLGTDTQTFDVIVTPYLDTEKNYGNVRNVYIKKGESKNIDCLLPHTESDSIRWYLEGLITNVTGPNLYLKDAKVSNDGNYTCRVSNGIGSTSETYLVEVGYPPTFKRKHYSTIINWNGDLNAVVNCDVKAKPEAKSYWWFNGKPVQNTDSLMLKISGWGDYICQISNVHGTVNRTFTVTSTSCLINRTAEASETIPILLNEMTLQWPKFESKHEFIVVHSKETFKLSCPAQENGRNSFQTFSDKTEIEATCDRKDSFFVDGKSYKFSDLRCKDRVLPVVIRTGEKCLYENTELIRVGFNVNDFIEAYVLCFDMNNNVPLSTRVNMSYSNIHNSPEYNKWFKYPGIDDGKVSNEYTCEKSSSSCCYAKGQLLNARDLSFGPAQTSTFIDQLNAIAIWRPCGDTHRMSWENLEESIRSELRKNPEFAVWSGASKFYKKNGGYIPRYLWKVLKSDVTSVAIVYVNDASHAETNILCKSICGDNGVPWTDKTDRFIYCCTIEDFLKAFDLPENIISF